MARPKGRAETVIFSQKAVVCRDADGTVCLSFRVGDFRSSQLIGVRINALLVRKVAEPASLGGHVRLNQEYLRIATETGADFFFLAWPIKIVHRIDSTSPLWELSPEALLMAGLEIIVILEACCEATGATTQVVGTHTCPSHLYSSIAVCLCCTSTVLRRIKLPKKGRKSIFKVFKMKNISLRDRQ